MIKYMYRTSYGSYMNAPPLSGCSFLQPRKKVNEKCGTLARNTLDTLIPFDMAGNRLSNVTLDQVKSKAIFDHPSVVYKLYLCSLLMVQGREPSHSNKLIICDEDFSSFPLNSYFS